MKILTRSAAIILAAVCLSSQAFAQTKPDRFKEQLEPVIKQVMEQANMPGFAIAVVENQKIVYAAGFGVKNLSTREPITAQSLFHMAFDHKAVRSHFDNAALGERQARPRLAGS